MWLYFNKNGALVKYLEHGTPARSGSNMFEIFAVFEGVNNTSTYSSAYITLIKPDANRTKYPSFPMQFLKHEKFVKLDGETNIGPFEDGKDYYGAYFSFHDFLGEIYDKILLDTPGLWNAVINLHTTKAKHDVQGIASFNVQSGTLRNFADGTTIEDDEIIQLYLTQLDLKMDKLGSQVIRYLNPEEGGIYEREYDDTVYQIGDILYNPTTRGFYRLNSYEVSAHTNPELLGYIVTAAERTKISESVQKVHGANLVYGTDGSANETTYPISEVATTGSVAKRKSNGRLTVGTPTENNDAATKQYVDEYHGTITKIKKNGVELPIVNKTVDITMDKTDVGLDNVDNTSDLNKPVSTAQQAAIETAVGVETTRATEVESGLAEEIASEEQRATEKEGALNVKIEAETTRAEGAESALSTRITNEVNRAIAKENELNGRIDNISALGRYLSTWNASEGVPDTPCPEALLPYLYKPGDYFIISVSGSKIPTGTGIPTTGVVPYTTTEEELLPGYIYRYDGSAWSLLKVAQKTVTIDMVAGLREALNGKADAATVNTHINNLDIHVTLVEKQAWNGHVQNTDIHVTTQDKGKWNDHVEDEDIHVTAQDKMNWSGKQDALTFATDAEVEALFEEE